MTATTTAGFPVLRLTCLQETRIDLSERKLGAWTAEEAAPYLVEKGDFFVSRGNGSLRLVGRGALLDAEPDPVAFPDTLIRVRPHECLILPSFLAEVWHSPETRQQIERKAKTTAGIYKVNQQDLGLISLPVPPLPEQQRIVNVLASYFTRLDDAVATLERVERNLKRYRASVLKSAVEGRLVPTEAALAKQHGRTYEPASVLLERILTERRRRWAESGKKGKYQDPLLPDTRNLPELPEGWSWASLDMLIEDGPQNGIYVPRTQYGSGTPILRIDDYQIGWSRSSTELQRVELSDVEAETYGLRLGDLVINRVNSPSHLGKSMSISEKNIPAVFESNMMRMTLWDRVDARYVQEYLSSVDGKARLIANAKWAVNQASINQGDVACTAIPLPPSAEQERIIVEVDRLVSAAQAITAVAVRNAKRCQRLRQSILKWAFEGKLADQDPNDEPASALLERIKAERGTPKPAKKTKRA